MAQRLSEKSLVILTLLAKGHNHAQIVDRHADITYLDICAAAREALSLNEALPDHQQRLAEIKRQQPRAYEGWTESELSALSAMFAQGRSVREMASRLQRQPSAITSRLAKLGLTHPDGSVSAR